MSGADSIWAAQWERVLDVIRTWPAERKRLTPDELRAYRDAFESPYGPDRAAICDPIELEGVLRALMLEDMEGRRPSIGAVHQKLRELRVERIETRQARAAVDWHDAEPAPTWTLAHALARRSPLAPLMQKIARDHGRPTHPDHDARACPLCDVERREAGFIEEQLADHGPRFRDRFEYVEERERFELELDTLHPWRVVGGR